MADETGSGNPFDISWLDENRNISSQMFSKSSLPRQQNMRTKGQQRIKTLTGGTNMLTQIKTTLNRSQSTLLQDAAGAVALVVILMVALHLPGTY
ncbi:hypothetical protein [Ruegeria faecimaris]|uniref:hypothetical protein n=1 Tax=Ruegeria faecimaris TaxID=686389 RepID=UPI002491126F|nr:hypothetical protein [Ruegeria faecimaris]